MNGLYAIYYVTELNCCLDETHPLQIILNRFVVANFAFWTFPLLPFIFLLIVCVPQCIPEPTRPSWRDRTYQELVNDDDIEAMFACQVMGESGCDGKVVRCNGCKLAACERCNNSGVCSRCNKAF